MRIYKFYVTTLALFLVASGTTLNVSAHDKDACVASAGSFTSQTGQPCESPIGLCTHGALSGEINAKYDFTFLTLVPANDPSDPSKFTYTGASVVTLNDGSGVLYTKDTGVVHMPLDNSPAPFITKAIADHGTRHLRATEGGFVARGNIDFGSGIASGTYDAVLCSRDR